MARFILALQFALGILIAHEMVVGQASQSFKLLLVKRGLIDEKFVDIAIYYQSSRKLDVEWYFMPYQRVPERWSRFSSVRGGSGIVTTDLTRAVYLKIGDFHGQYSTLECKWIGGEKVHVSLETKSILVQPGHDLAYQRGDAVQVSLSTEQQWSFVKNFHHAAWIDPDTNTLATNRTPDFVSWETGPSNELNLTFNTDVKAINGIFIQEVATHWVSRNDSLVRNVWHYVTLKVHENTITGPFPDSFLNVEMYTTKSGEKGVRCHLWDRYCDIWCDATGNVVESVSVSQGGDDVQLEMEQPYPYTLTRRLRLGWDDYREDNYTCTATMKKIIVRNVTVPVKFL